MEQVKVQREVYRQKRRERDNRPIGSTRHTHPCTQCQCQTKPYTMIPYTLNPKP